MRIFRFCLKSGNVYSTSSEPFHAITTLSWKMSCRCLKGLFSLKKTMCIGQNHAMWKALEESVSHVTAKALSSWPLRSRVQGTWRHTDKTRVCDTESILSSHSSAIYSYYQGQDSEGRGRAENCSSDSDLGCLSDLETASSPPRWKQFFSWHVQKSWKN